MGASVSLRLSSSTQNGIEPKKGIQTTFKLASNSLSFFDMANKVFAELGVIQLMRPQLFEALKVIGDQEPDLETIRETADFLYKKMMRSRN